MNRVNIINLSSVVLRQLNGIHSNSKSILTQNVAFGYVRCLSLNKGSPASRPHRPNTVDKYLLVWMKKYPSVKEVPNEVSGDMMEKTRNWARIKLNILFCILTAVVCIFMIKSGKDAAARGETLTKMNQRWHEEQNAKK